MLIRTEHRYHWADVIVNTTYMNDVMRAVCVIPGLFSILEWWKTDRMKRTLYQHAAYATEHTEAYLYLNIPAECLANRLADVSNILPLAETSPTTFSLRKVLGPPTSRLHRTSMSS